LPSITSGDRCRASLPSITARARRTPRHRGSWWPMGATRHRPHARSLSPHGTHTIGSNPEPPDEPSRRQKTSSFSKSKFSMATLFAWRNLMWDGRCKAVHIVSTIESVERSQLRCEECTQLRCAERTRLMNVSNCAELNECG
jgi:hypothetical protein